jgi:hypothetical protein
MKEEEDCGVWDPAVLRSTGTVNFILDEVNEDLLKHLMGIYETPVPNKKTLIRDAGETIETMKEIKDAQVQD